MGSYSKSLDTDNHSRAPAPRFLTETIAVALICVSLTLRAGGQRTTQSATRPADPESALPLAMPSLALEDKGRGTENATVRIATYIQLAYASGEKSFHLRGSSAELTRQVLGAFGIVAIVADRDGEPAFRFDIDDVDYPAAADLIRLATASLFVALDPTHVFVVKDTKEHRETLQRMITEVLYLPALSANELQDAGNIAKNIFEAKQVTVQPASSTLTVRAAESTLRALNDTLIDLLGGQDQIAVDMRLLETDQSRTIDAGLQLPQSSTVFNVDSEAQSVLNSNSSAVSEIISSGLASSGDTLAILAILAEEGLLTGVLSEPFAVFGGGITETGITFGTVTANLELDSSDSRLLDQSLVKVQENEPATLTIGSRYPIETSSYTGSYYTSSGKVSSSTTPEVQYQDIGFSLKVTPRTEGGHRIHLAIDMKVQALEGSSLNGIPVLTDRSLTTQAAVPEGASAILTSYVSKSGSGTLDQLPGLSGATTNNSGQTSASQLVVVVTPYWVRKGHHDSVGPLALMPVHD
jgi:general secretion pathway protein D